MFHTCVTRFDVTENLENFLVFGAKQDRDIYCHSLQDKLHAVSGHAWPRRPYSLSAFGYDPLNADALFRSLAC